MRILGAILLFFGVLIYLGFGTLSPCGILREVARKQDTLVAMLPDGIIDAALIRNYGALSPGRCLSVLAYYVTQPNRTIASEPKMESVSTSTPLTGEDAIKAAGRATEVANNECRAKRLSGELKTYVDSVKCSNPQMIQAFKSANYRYMDLIMLYASRKSALAERIDRHEITDEQAQIENRKAFIKIQELERRRDLAK